MSHHVYTQAISTTERNAAMADTAPPCATVPIGELSFLRDVFMGAKLSTNQIAAIERLSSYLPRTVADESECSTSAEDRIR